MRGLTGLCESDLESERLPKCSGFGPNGLNNRQVVCAFVEAEKQGLGVCCL